MIRAILCTLLLLVSSLAQARELKVATWNLGWHLSASEADQWIGKCGAPFKQNAEGLWEASDSGTPGWQLRWGRDAPIVWDIANWPPCDIFKTPAFDIAPVTHDAYNKRLQQLRSFIEQRLGADILAFQEVSGEAAVRDALPDGGKDYNVCAFTEFKVQRLAFAWKKSLGEAVECKAEPAITLPSLPAKDQVRPGLSVALNIDGQKLHLLTVHLKSSCVSPVEATGDTGRGALAGAEPACVVLQQQAVPLETWIESKTSDTDFVIVLGDFNRALWHEAHRTDPVRTDDSDPAAPRPSGSKVRNLFLEVNDGAPASSKLTLLAETCPLNPATDTACQKAENPASLQEWKDSSALLAKAENLGCRNPVGLDHILVSSGFTAVSDAQKVALGREGRTLPANATHPNPLLALSDHCPMIATVALGREEASQETADLANPMRLRPIAGTALARGECLPARTPAAAPLVCASPLGGQAEASAPTSPPVHEFLDATLWVQTAPEYTISTYQAYALATIRLKEALADADWNALPGLPLDPNRKEPPGLAIIMDVDETVLDNSPFQGQLVHDNIEADDPTWDRWVKLERARAIRGAVEFVKFATADPKVRVYYVTNRSHGVWQATARNLRAAGFPVDEDGGNLLSLGKQDGWSTDKQSRRAFVASTNRVLMLIGDDLNDFVAGVKGEGVTPAARQEIAERNVANWGTKWIMIPNPMYGSWERATFEAKKLGRQEKLERKMNRLNRF